MDNSNKCYVVLLASCFLAALYTCPYSSAESVPICARSGVEVDSEFPHFLSGLSTSCPQSHWVTLPLQFLSLEWKIGPSATIWGPVFLLCVFGSYSYLAPQRLAAADRTASFRARSKMRRISTLLLILYEALCEHCMKHCTNTIMLAHLHPRLFAEVAVPGQGSLGVFLDYFGLSFHDGQSGTSIGPAENRRGSGGQRQ